MSNTMPASAVRNLLEQHKVKGFLPENEAEALYAAACLAAQKGPILEVGSFCGFSAVYLGYAAKAANSLVFTVDHHRGSEEHQQGELYHDAELFDVKSGRVDTLPSLRRTLALCDIEEYVSPVIASSQILANYWATPLALIFIDGGHTEQQAYDDCIGWAKHLMPEGILAVHDIFEDPTEGGQAPWYALQRFMKETAFTMNAREGSLVFLQRV